VTRLIAKKAASMKGKLQSKMSLTNPSHSLVTFVKSARMERALLGINCWSPTNEDVKGSGRLKREQRCSWQQVLTMPLLGGKEWKKISEEAD
jgi:hypothetical protein